MNDNYTAYYAPALSEGKESPTKSGFKTYDETVKWIEENYICQDCITESKQEDESPINSACGCEWFIVPTEKLLGCNDFGEILEASGAQRIWTKETEESQEN